MIRIISVLIYLYIHSITYTQTESSFAKSLKINLTGTYIFDSKEVNGNNFHEFVIGTQASFSITKSLYFGGQFLLILTKDNYEKKMNNYFLSGVFVNYDVLPKKRLNLYPEVSFSIGNYCTCDKDKPYRVNNLKYLGMGIGVDIPISKRNNFYIHTSFNAHFIVNSIPKKSSFNIYRVGLLYKLGD